MVIDFYARVIDNYGDIGFALNFAINLSKRYPGLKINIFTSDPDLCRKLINGKDYEFLKIYDLGDLYKDNEFIPSDTIFNFFKNPLPIEFLKKHNFPKKIINFDYMVFDKSFEKFHEFDHHHSNDINDIIHYVLGCTGKLGGVIIDQFKEIKNEGFTMSIFSYDKEFSWLIDYLKDKNVKTYICGGLSQSKFTGTDPEKFIMQPFLNIEDYGDFLASHHINFVRGENSIIQSLIAGRISIWDIYKEINDDHWNKLTFYFEYIKEYFEDPIMFDNYVNLNIYYNKNENYIEYFDFVYKNYEKYEQIFKKIGENIRVNYDLAKKLEKHIDFNS